jgi:signal peptidase II
MSDAPGIPATARADSVGAARGASYGFLAVTALVTLVADLGTKIWAERRLGTGAGLLRPVDLIDGYLDLVLAKNPAGAWSMLQDVPDAIRRPMFMILSVAAIVFIVSVYRRLLPGQRALRWGLPLVLGGALGNLVDRIRYSYVIDFIHMHATWGGRDHHWPTYNVADIAICVGVGLMVLDMLVGPKSRAVQPNADAP